MIWRELKIAVLGLQPWLKLEKTKKKKKKTEKDVKRRLLLDNC